MTTPLRSFAQSLPSGSLFGRTESEGAAMRWSMWGAAGLGALALFGALPAFGAGPSGAFCGKAGPALMVGEGDPGALIQQVARECSVGDVIILPGQNSAAIARLCDFNRSVLPAPSGVVLCVMGPLKNERP